MPGTQDGGKHLAKLQAAGMIHLRRATRIVASPGNSESKLLSNQKLVHLQRHGQAFHNLMADNMRENGVKLETDKGETTCSCECPQFAMRVQCKE